MSKSGGISYLVLNDYSPEKAGGGGSIPSLATAFSRHLAPAAEMFKAGWNVEREIAFLSACDCCSQWQCRRRCNKVRSKSVFVDPQAFDLRLERLSRDA
jgi:hypothetical protein